MVPECDFDPVRFVIDATVAAVSGDRDVIAAVSVTFARGPHGLFAAHLHECLAEARCRGLSTQLTLAPGSATVRFSRGDVPAA